MAEGQHPADTNGDGVVSNEEHEMYLWNMRKEMEDADAQRDAGPIPLTLGGARGSCLEGPGPSWAPCSPVRHGGAGGMPTASS